MKIEKLNENKIKITFNIDDLEEKNIDLYSFLHNTPETQDLFWSLLNEAEKECGFNVDNSMIYVEATTSGAGNFVLIVTKTNEKPHALHEKAQNYKNKSIKLKRKQPNVHEEEVVYSFNNWDDICDFAKLVSCQEIHENSLYQMEGHYYLRTSYMPYPNIMEYATLCPSQQIVKGKIEEYGSLIIADNALQTVQHFFNKKRKKS